MSDIKHIRQTAAALRQLELLEKQSAFDPINLKSRATPAQRQVFDEFGTYKQVWVRAGNQCLTGDTLVATPTGPIRIDAIKPGDIVYSEHGLPIKVLKTFSNGIKEVSDLTCRGVRWASSTENHVFQVVTPHGNVEQKRASSFGRDDQVTRVTVKSDLGAVSNPTAYALGALLGDGCSRQPHKYVQISSGTSAIPEKAASVCGTSARKLHEGNYTWSIGYADILHYTEWCKGRYAHEKIVDLDIIKTWDRTSLLQFVAGLIDTDGSIYSARDHVSLTLGMQARSVIEAFEYAVLALWQVPLNRTIDNRTKYKNGPLHIAYTRNVHHVREILAELDTYLVSPQKKWREGYEALGGKRSCSDSIGLKFGFNRREEETYDIHVDSETNLYLLANGLVTHNSGKSQVCARLLTWVLLGTHPTWKRPEKWGDEPLLMLVAGRTGKQIEDSLLPKIRSYLPAGTYKEVRIGNIIQRIEMENGDRIVFQSLENPNVARERLMSYVAHLTWVDELPPTLDLVREILIRTQARDGYSLFSFTPTVVNVDIQKFVDSLSEPDARVYRFKMLDNPLYSDPVRKQELINRYSHLPEHVQSAIFEGDWMSADDMVYYFDYRTMVEMPQNYSPLHWRHVEAVDPALKSALGLTVWAEDPQTAIWYCVLAQYIRGIYVPTELVEAVRKRTSPFNVVRRIADPHEVWYIQTAGSMGITYQGVYKKNDRKSELIKGLQEKLGPSLRISPLECSDLITELQDCRWSSSGEGKIVNSSSYHLLDSAQYFADNIPKSEHSPVKDFTLNKWYEKLLTANAQRLDMEDRVAAAKSNTTRMRILRKVGKTRQWR